jgi:hypothetical protein
MKEFTYINAPKRIQRSRKKGYKTPENTVYVGRPSKFGNPFRLTPDGYIQCYSIGRMIFNPWIMWSHTDGFESKDIVALYDQWLNGKLKVIAPYLPTPPDYSVLKGKDLSCWCPLDQPCHADVLLKLANS